MNKITIFLLGIILMTSCKKESILDELESNKTMSQDNNLAESSADDASIIADEAYYNNKLTSRGGSSGSGILGDTVKITRDSNSITIDFGTTGITSLRDGKTRKGKITASWTGGFKIENSSVTITFDNFYVDGNKVVGSRTITYKGNNTTHGINGSNHPWWTISSNLTITKTDGKVVTWTSERKRVQVAGESNPGKGNDEFKITGSANGTTSLGDTYSMTIGTPLYVKVSCKHIQDGTLTVTKNTKSFELNYGIGGQGSCDDQAELTYNGNKYTIQLK